MKDDHNILANGRRPQYFVNWMKTAIFCPMEDDLNILRNGRQPQSVVKLKIMSILEKGRQPQYLVKQR
jgi:hypothetical protein